MTSWVEDVLNVGLNAPAWNDPETVGRLQFSLVIANRSEGAIEQVRVQIRASGVPGYLRERTRETK